MRVLDIVYLGLAALGLARACETDEDCSLNGVCIDGPDSPKNSDHPGILSRICKCDPGWFGEDCGRLDLAPATRYTGYNYTNVTDPSYYGKYGNSSWGGDILQDPDDPTLFHLFASQFSYGCGLSGWRPHSFIMRAESRNGPQGPYHFAETVAPAFRHNSYVFFSPADNKYLLYTIGVDAPKPEKCQSISNTRWPNNISVASSDSIRGPWTPFKMILNSKDPQSTNPAPWPLWFPENPTSQIIMGVEGNAIFIADTWDGEYKLMYTQKWNTTKYSPTWTEDPFFWRDKRGNWHTLTHWMIDIVEHDGQKWPRVGAHMYARNLTGPWYFKLHEAFNSTVAFTDGSVETLKRRERPKIFFSDDGEMTPLYLINGVQSMNESSRSYTLIQPIGTKWKQYEKDLGFYSDLQYRYLSNDGHPGPIGDDFGKERT
ncbi:hypothetical protein F9C07_1178350 [Aspergillus flavus]|uniref:Uncharacterized protein n=2 Tax=Aspergillus subgen. Circumdati TaxID=2720871 RepID=A0A7G5JTT7_ASPFN|nr:uncharacterized protein G4B84_002238 [Aspergillus flavus NRRL3357]EIT72914.1 hypothetical protein Ao3042_11197 [Aspergillus oryzae 3.042]KDE84751.1 hypothetical protein AO1008_00043 [Aspergillus oryzae 100-8]QMW39029.1 hypothetical protein G4B11_002309 [Aspergillus flavus]KAF7631362.1 hypothetical protein AFLA_012220 [Aspergillus flavus NRRL3357]QMW26949.1 hypothetical protein G4B84_002238 [Aspergillus flavus NRRL3357]|eukprot:EIT72914.1 hypothetical protein Ao3042_11197 [Aspergillus oryzae 3.042]